MEGTASRLARRRSREWRHLEAQVRQEAPEGRVLSLRCRQQPPSCLRADSVTVRDDGRAHQVDRDARLLWWRDGFRIKG
jgi:hypothetical protein